ncbi:MAG: hypothetical protein ACRDH6_09045 [Actinomycetota bacterium]
MRIALLLVLAGAVTGGTLGALAAGGGSDDKRAAVARFGVRVENALIAASLGQPVGTGFLVLPELGESVAQFQGGDLGVKELRDGAEDWRARATEGADAIDAIRAPNPQLAEAAIRMSQALRLYSSLARSVRIATGLDEEEQAALIETVFEQLTVVAGQFDGGWQQLQAERTRVGIELVPAAPAPFPSG